jgi:hypothetical protein
MMFGGMKPIQKSTTCRARAASPKTRTVDDAIAPSVGVSVDPAGVANALMTLMQK